MKLGLYTEAFRSQSFDQMLETADGIGFDCLEISCGNWGSGNHIDIDTLLESATARSEYLGAISARDMTLDALNCSGNQLDPRELGCEHQKVVEKTFRLAGLLGVKKIVMMAGLPGGAPDARYPVWVTTTWPVIMQEMLEYQWTVAIPYWQEAARMAADCGVDCIALENHPNALMYNVETMRRLRDAAGPMLGINLDPSHTFYLGGDPIAMAKVLAAEGLVYHVHGKDTRIETQAAALNTLMETKPDPLADRAWNYVAVGFGHDYIWWKNFMAALKINGYDGTVSIEVEDRTMDIHTAISRSASFLREVMM